MIISVRWDGNEYTSRSATNAQTLDMNHSNLGTKCPLAQKDRILSERSEKNNNKTENAVGTSFQTYQFDLLFDIIAIFL